MTTQRRGVRVFGQGEIPIQVVVVRPSPYQHQDWREDQIGHQALAENLPRS